MKRIKQIFTILLVCMLTVNSFTVVSRADSENGKEGYTKIFRNSTKGGTLYLKDADGNTLDKLGAGEEVIYTYPSGKYPDEIFVEAKAKDGYVVSSYKAAWLLNDEQMDTCESVYDMNKQTYKRSHYLATAEYDEVFTVTFEEEGSSLLIQRAAVNVAATFAPDIDNPTVGDVYKGKGKLTYNGKKTSPYNGTGYIRCTSGEFKGEQITLANCASGSDHWAPQTGQTGTYTITITKVNKKTGKIKCKAEWKNDSYTAGYQNLSGTFSYYNSFDGALKVYKESGEVEGSFYMHSDMKNADLSATFQIFTDEACTTHPAGDYILTTDSDGKCEDSIDLPVGTYYVRETIPPRGFALNEGVFKIKVKKSSTKSVTVKDNMIRAKITGVKIDALTGSSSPTVGLSLAGAKYGVYEDKECTRLCTTGTSDADGNIAFEIEYLSIGRYYVKEISAPSGYKLNPKVISIEVRESNAVTDSTGLLEHEVTFTSVEEPELGEAKVIKKSANENITNGNRCYSLAGCKFQLTSVATGEAVKDLLVTDANGETQELKVAVGQYKVKEVEAPEGFLLNTEEQVITVTESEPGKVVFYDKPSDDPVGVLLRKVDKETGTEVSVGAGELAGAEYTFCYYDGQYTTEEQVSDVTPIRTWVMATDEEGEILFKTAEKVSGDEFYINDDGVRCIPLGTLTIQETKAPEGYLLDDTLYIQNITADSDGSIVQSYQAPTLPEEIKRGDLKGVKVSAGDYKRMADIPFKITSVETGESHVVLTDANGVFDTSSSHNLHSMNTNRGETSSDGVWFGSVDALDDKAGALPYGSYLIEELSCEANSDRVLIDAFEVAVTKDSITVDLGTLVNEYIPVPEIGTKATVKDTGLQAAYAGASITIIDEVEYTGLTKGEEYTLKGVAMDVATGEPIVVNSSKVTREKKFIAERTYGVLDMDFIFDGSTLAGKQIVWFEYLYHDGKQVASHTDLKDKKQTITFKNPSISTTATERETGTHEAYIAEDITIDDVVTYKGVIAGEEYTVKGVVMDTETGKAVKVNGKEITSEISFVANNAKGTVTLSYKLDSRKLAGKKYVWYEYMYYGDVLIASHEDITDEKQMITFKAPSEEEKTTRTTPKTGDGVNVPVILLLMVVCLSGVVFVLVKRKLNKKI